MKLNMTVPATLAALLLPLPVRAQITFVRTLGDTGPNVGLCVQRTSDGGYVITGNTGFDPVRIYLMKTDAWGETLWTRSYNGLPFDGGHWVEQTDDGGYAIIAETERMGFDILFIKTDTIGLTSWTRTYGGAGGDGCFCLQQTFDRGYIIAGWTSAYGSEVCDVLLVKTDANGDTLWTRAIGGVSSDIGYAVQQTADSGYVVAGVTESFGAGYNDYYLIRTNADGDTLWTRTYGGPRSDECRSVQQTADGGYILGGYSASFGLSDWGVYLVKTDANGDTMWTRTYVIMGANLGWCARQTTDGGYVVAGHTEDTCTNETKAFLLRADCNGVMLWAKTFDSSDSLGSEGYSVLQATDGGFVLAGFAECLYARDDVLLVKTAPDGTVAVAGSKASPKWQQRLTLTCEPNPCRSSTVLHLTTGPLDHSTTLLRIFDASGRMVWAEPVRTSSPILHPSSLPAGAYFLRIDAGNQHVTTRLVVQR